MYKSLQNTNANPHLIYEGIPCLLYVQLYYSLSRYGVSYVRWGCNVNEFAALQTLVPEAYI